MLVVLGQDPGRTDLGSDMAVLKIHNASGCNHNDQKNKKPCGGEKMTCTVVSG
jgi:hypothetical protein